MMVFLIIAGGGLSLSQEHVEKWRKQRQQVGPWIRKKDSKGPYDVQVDTLLKCSVQLMLASVFTSWNSGNKRTCFAQLRPHCDLLKKIISVFYSLHRNYYFLSENVIF